jgi:putative oxidoreductase
MKYLLITGRILFSLIFLLTVVSHFNQETIDYAAAQGVPAASFLVPFSAVIAFIGGLCIAIGYRTKTGGLLILIFLVPVTIYMHAFWKETDPMKKKMQMGNFMKNVSLMGAALLITCFGGESLESEKNYKNNNK